MTSPFKADPCGKISMTTCGNNAMTAYVVQKERGGEQIYFLFGPSREDRHPHFCFTSEWQGCGTEEEFLKAIQGKCIVEEKYAYVPFSSTFVSFGDSSVRRKELGPYSRIESPMDLDDLLAQKAF